jgi:hypothetical protein
MAPSMGVNEIGIFSNFLFNFDNNFSFFLMKDLSILLIRDHEYKTLTPQNIKFCKIIVTCYEVI